MIKKIKDIDSMTIVSGFEFNSEVHRFGKLCKREHDHEGMGKSLRYKCNGSCVYCDDIRWRAWDAKNRPPQVNRDAIVRVYVDSIEFDESIHKLSKTICKKGHDHQGLNKCLRYKTTGTCVYCMYERRASLRDELVAKDRERYHALPVEERQRMGREQRARQDKEKVREYFRNYYYSERGSVVTKNSRDKFRNSEKGRVLSQKKSRIRRMRLKNVVIGNYTPEETNERRLAFGFCCAYCGVPDNGKKRFMQLDHVIAISRGGADAMTNLVPSCIHCNASKNDAHLEIWYGKKQFATLERLVKVLSFLGDEELKIFDSTQLGELISCLSTKN